jgi:hypothetical protein
VLLTKGCEQRRLNPHWSFLGWVRCSYPLQPACQRALIGEPRRTPRARLRVRQRSLAERRVHHLTSGNVAYNTLQIKTVHAKHLAGLTSSEAELRSRAVRSFSTSSSRPR